MEGRGSIGFSGLMFLASLAACSMASISSLQPAWSSGQTTIGCLRTISLAEVRWAYNVVNWWNEGKLDTVFEVVHTLTVK